MQNKTLIIAEAGVNHNGNLELAKKLIDAAVEAGVDFVKFQTFKTENLVSKVAKKADYQERNTIAEDTQFEMLKKLELSVDDHHVLINYCSQKKINFFSTGFDLPSLDLLFELGLRLYKIPSGEITNLPYLRKVANLAEKVIISTGMSTMRDIELAIQVFLDYGFHKKNIIVLHCNTEYPTPFADVNLKAMKTIADKFGVKIGYSDHTVGIEVPIAAVALGATVIEKHFTLDRTLDGPDHAASLEPEELANMVSAIRNIELALGNGIKNPSESEMKNISIARKSIHTSRKLVAGSIIEERDLIMLRPGDGISPMQYDEIIGKKVNCELPANHKIELNELSN